MVDHSQTYKVYSVRNIGHMWRARSLVRQVSKLPLPEKAVHVDVGCSNGYFTDAVARSAKAHQVIGLDFNQENLEKARRDYPHYRFMRVDLNQPLADLGFQADLVTCLETLEHVGYWQTALDNVAKLAKPGGVMLVTVPIESGPIGAIKYVVKTKIFGYKLDELSSDPEVCRQYERAVLKGHRISGFRNERPGWATHFGFDYRDLEEEIRRRFSLMFVRTVGTTRVFAFRHRQEKAAGGSAGPGSGAPDSSPDR